MHIENRIDELRALSATSLPFTEFGYCAAFEIASGHRRESGEFSGNIPRLTVVPRAIYEESLSVMSAIFFGGAIGPRPAHPLRGCTDLMWHPKISDQPRRWYIIGQVAAFAFECPES